MGSADGPLSEELNSPRGEIADISLREGHGKKNNTRGKGSRERWDLKTDRSSGYTRFSKKPEDRTYVTRIYAASPKREPAALGLA